MTQTLLCQGGFRKASSSAGSLGSDGRVHRLEMAFLAAARAIVTKCKNIKTIPVTTTTTDAVAGSPQCTTGYIQGFPKLKNILILMSYIPFSCCLIIVALKIYSENKLPCSFAC